MPNFLWAFTPTSPSTTSNTANPQGNNPSGVTPSQNAITPMPVLTPTGKNGNSKFTEINVVRDFYWTYSPLGDAGRAEVPRIRLTEKRLKTNSLIAQLQYTLGALENGGAKLVQDAGATNLSKLLQQYANSPGAAGALLGSDDNPTTKASPYLQPYRNLYITENTKWVYTLPYFDNNHTKQDNAFSEGGGQGKGLIGSFAKEGLGVLEGIAEDVSQVGSPTEYTFIEKTKFYDYPTDGESVTVEFPLINTGSATYDDVVRNWQFIYLLVYQNRPGKTGFNTVDQPVIYEVSIPGTKFFPYCYISNLNVEFVGSRREMTMAIPSLNSSVNSAQTSVSNSQGTTNITTIIPDAYKISITLQSMNANTRNFMSHMISSQNIIQTGTDTGNVPSPRAGLTVTSPIINPGSGFGSRGPGAQ